MAFSEELINFLNDVQAFQQTHMPYQLWYRGQGVDKPLNSGLFRLNITSLEELKNLERNAYFMFRNLGQPLLKKETDFELLNIMQHHGVKTRLLDWTPSLLIAIYFALEEADSPVLWLLSPNKMNKILINEDSIPTPPFNMSYENAISNHEVILNSVAIHPTRNSPRQSVQQGFFTIQSDNQVPLELEHNELLTKSGSLKKILINETLKQDLKWYLQLNSVNYFSVYPDLEGLSRHINKFVFRS
ncbi:hypothetical protein BK131_00680 [Paenibacillus amylolyticus]|uniref:FRG domain-containing protein n=1 Tax=Paenibacillus amylolyticus TaxID=1451 RepID=A0A1R1C349_PAEAM|nr:FRG domain-containing protein [Paenibacillus amylolyticus]OMF16550.1 hypothetical protein BK131_00680 [Paenibacillus amylolyticus]